MSSVPNLTISATGVSVPETSAVLAGVLADYNAAFDGNLNITSEGTPQKHLADDTTYYIQLMNSLIAYVCNQVDPANSEGRFQDAIGRIYFLTRRAATATVVNAQCVGQPGATLPAGALASDGEFIYQSTGAATFNGSGLATVEFACQTLGPIPCPAGALTRIAQTSPGWDAVTNPSAGVIGQSVETRTEFEYRRGLSVAVNGKGSPGAIRGAVFSVDGVIDCYVIDNPTGVAVTFGATSYSVAAHSVYVAAVGGTDQAVADAIWSKKDVGCSMNGNTTVTVYDDTALSFPYPTYSIKFERPAALPILFAVNIANHPGLPADIVTQAKAAIIAAFTGADGGQRARIGSDIYASRYYAGVASIATTVRVVSIKIGTTTATLDEVLVGIDEVPTIDANDIAVNLV